MKKRKVKAVSTKLFDQILGLIPADWSGMVELAEEAEICPQTLWSWATGHTLQPRITTIVKVAGALGFEVELAKVRPAGVKPLRLVRGGVR